MKRASECEIRKEMAMVNTTRFKQIINDFPQTPQITQERKIDIENEPLREESISNVDKIN